MKLSIVRRISKMEHSLMNYWKEVADLTQGIESLKATNVFAIGEYDSLQLIASNQLCEGTEHVRDQVLV